MLEFDSKGRQVVAALQTRREYFWFNPERNKCNKSDIKQVPGLAEMQEAANRLKRFAPWIAQEFPETSGSGGLIESPLVRIDHMKRKLDPAAGVAGQLYLKRDDILPVSGSIKARGGIYEILKLAESIALKHGLITLADDYSFCPHRTIKIFSHGMR